MPPNYAYDIWNGKEVIGCYNTSNRIWGKFLIIPTISEFKRMYKKYYETIKVPIILRSVYNDGVEMRFRYTLDVRKKSKRQIAIIIGDNK